MNSKGWSEAQEVVWRVVLLDVFEKVLILDYRQLLATDLKIGNALAKMIKDLIPYVQKEAAKARDRLREMGARIVEVRQLPHAREVRVVYKGYHFKLSYLNGLIQAECEELLLSYLRGQK